jgi:hypothetical protein
MLDSSRNWWYICRLLSNGFKLELQWMVIISSGVQYIYMAIAENPFVTSTGVPATAR